MIGSGIGITPIGAAPSSGSISNAGGYRSFFGRWLGGVTAPSSTPPVADAGIYIPVFRRRRR